VERISRHDGQSVNVQRANNTRYRRRANERRPNAYSITSSARASSDGGNARARALAVLGKADVPLTTARSSQRKCNYKCDSEILCHILIPSVMFLSIVGASADSAALNLRREQLTPGGPQSGWGDWQIAALLVPLRSRSAQAEAALASHRRFWRRRPKASPL